MLETDLTVDRLFLSALRDWLPIYFNRILHENLNGSSFFHLRHIFDALHSTLSVLRRSGYPVDDFNAGTDKFISLCSTFMEMNSKSHEEICRCKYVKQSNAMKEIVAQFQATDRLNDLPQELMNDILARMILQRVIEKIIATVDNLISLLPPPSSKSVVHYIHTLLY
ncbi:hypothetical protein AAC387_Pa07g3677 [Persea americana]